MPIKEKDRRRSPQMGEAGFTLIEMVIVIVLTSILGVFIFGVLTKCLDAQKNMQVRKERSDDAVQSMDKINRELREAFKVWSALDDELLFQKSSTSSIDTNLYVLYIRDTASRTLRRQSEENIADFSWPFDSTLGSVIATDISLFTSTFGGNSWLTLQYEFDFDSDGSGSEWVTYVLPRNRPEPSP